MPLTYDDYPTYWCVSYPKELVGKTEEEIISNIIDEHLDEFKEGDGDGNCKKLEKAVEKEFDNAIDIDTGILRGMTGDKLKEVDEIRREIGDLEKKKKILKKVSDCTRP